ncbi:DUF1906 domain-containing protein [Streptomyces longispororuber]|uniref:DUF1906 domain-containing protein n=1 Tax=Streptomyces longispororuber TaxID=68230 RepID=UPI0033FEE586
MRHRKLITGLVLSLSLATLALDTSAPPQGPARVPGAAAPADPEPDPELDPDDPDLDFDPEGAAPTVFRGRAFDTCMTPSAGAMRRWLASPYRAVGVYFGGRGRACPKQPRLTPAWVEEVDEMGWKVLPLYVGSQSPCVRARNKQHVRMGGDPGRQGAREGYDAVRRAEALGFGQDSPLYLDMEAYAYRNKKCARATLTFVRAWNREVRSEGYVPGFYSSADSGVRHMESARRAGVADLPSVMWFARWNQRPDLYGEPVLARNAWRPARRIHQYAGNVKERHGGLTMRIDRNLVHAPVAQLG